MDYPTLLGATGALLILIAFIMNQTHRWKDDYFIYDIVNLIGSALLTVYAILLNSFPFVILNLVWMTVSAKDVVEDLALIQKKKRSIFRKWLR